LKGTFRSDATRNEQNLRSLPKLEEDPSNQKNHTLFRNEEGSAEVKYCWAGGSLLVYHAAELLLLLR